jgi:hypothetical protein
MECTPNFVTPTEGPMGEVHREWGLTFKPFLLGSGAGQTFTQLKKKPRGLGRHRGFRFLGSGNRDGAGRRLFSR